MEEEKKVRNMATYTNEQIECPHCGKDVRIKAYDTVDGRREPKLKQQIIKGTFFDHECPHCHKKIVLYYDIVYTDPANGACVILADSDEYCEDALNDLSGSKEERDMFDGSVYSAAEASRLRIVRNSRELAEKALIFGLGLDDRILEILKKIHLAMTQKEDPGIEDLVFNFGHFKNGKSEMMFLPVAGGEVGDTYQIIKKQEYDAACEEFSGPMKNYREDTLIVNREWADGFMRFKDENYPRNFIPSDSGKEEEIETEDDPLMQEIGEAYEGFLSHYNRDEDLAAYGEEHWDGFLKKILDCWYEDGDDRKPKMKDIDDHFGFDIGSLIENLDMASWNAGLHVFRKRLCADVLNCFDLEEDPRTRHDMRRFYAESLEKTEGIQAASAYLKDWQKEETGSAYVIGTLIQFHLDHGDQEKALELAEKYLHMELREDGDEWLYDACENLYYDMGNKDRLDQIDSLRRKNRKY